MAEIAEPIARAAADLDFDADRIFRFVADEIRYEPYAGILRGATGTLAAGAGNSVDKALLLGALLDASMISYRFARGSLDPATTTRIVDSMATDLAAARDVAMAPLRRGADELARTAIGTPSPSEAPVLTDEEVRAVEAEGAQRLELARSRLGATVTMLSDALDSAGIDLPSGTDVSLPMTEVAEHTWVEMQRGPSWVPLDPTLAATQPGAALATASETLDQLPDDLRYRIAFDVSVERVEGGQLTRESVLEYEDFADRLAGLPVSFAHVTPSGMQQIGISLSALFGGGWIDYRPVLDLGDRSIVADQAVAIPTGEGGDILSADPAASPGVPIEGEATAEWLEVRVTAPGSDPVVARRAVFDRLGPDVRHDGTPTVEAVEPVTLVDVDGTGTLDYAPMLGVETFAIATGPTSVAPVIAAADDGLGMAALVYHNLRDLIGAGIALDAGARTFIDGPNIASLVVEVDASGGPEAASDLRVGFDIWHRSHGVLPLATPLASNAESELVAGVTDQLAERFALGYLAASTDPGPRSIGVGAVFEAAAAQGIPTVVLRGSVPDRLPYGAEAVASIAAAMTAGQVVVVPATSVTLDGTERVGWWSIDPVTGETIDVMDDGSGSEFGEYGVVIRSRVGLVRCYGSLAAMAAAQIMMATSTLMAINVLGMWKPGAGPGGTACLAI